MIPIPPLATVRKLAVYIVAIGTAIPAAVVIPDPWDVLVPLVIAIAGAVAHYNIPDAPISGTGDAPYPVVASHVVSPPPLSIDSAAALNVAQS